MALTPSTMLPLGTKAPDFSLPDPDGANHTLQSLADGKNGLIVAFWCNHCPFVKHFKRYFAQFCREHAEQGIASVAIMSNDVDSYPDDSPELMKADAEKYEYPFPYLIDADQSVAKAYRAACTPDFYLFDEDLRLVYRGRLDSSRPGNDEPINGEDMGEAIERLLAGKEISSEQYPSMGCNIKWKT